MNKVQYREYLRSDDWKLKKEFKASRTHKRCSICAVTQFIQLHHLFYRTTPEQSDNSDLRWLCGRCHQLTHELIKAGLLVFPKPNNHHSCFAFTKNAVKKALNLGHKNMFVCN